MLETQIILSVISIVLLGLAWYRHYMVPDGIGRQILLWLNFFLISFFLFRAIGYFLEAIGIMNIVQSKGWNQVNLSWLYFIVIGQFLLQMRRR